MKIKKFHLLKLKFLIFIEAEISKRASQKRDNSVGKKKKKRLDK